jgi:hypothetical protein
LPALALSFPLTHPPAPPQAASAAVVRAIPLGVPVYVPVGLYPAVADRLNVGCWESMGPLGRTAGARGRYAWIVLWPDGDPPGEPHDAPLVALLATDRRFRRVDGFAPLVVYERR